MSKNTSFINYVKGKPIKFILKDLRIVIKVALLFDRI